MFSFGGRQRRRESFPSLKKSSCLWFSFGHPDEPPSTLSGRLLLSEQVPLTFPPTTPLRGSRREMPFSVALPQERKLQVFQKGRCQIYQKRDSTARLLVK